MKRTVAQWNATRAKLKRKFATIGVTACEMCGRRTHLSFAHRLKRRYITTRDELEQVALLCTSGPDWIGCHDTLEGLEPELMFTAITNLINKRENRIEAFRLSA